MRLVKGWWKIIIFNILWLGSLITAIGYISPLIAKLGGDLLATVTIVLLLTVLGKQLSELNRWCHKKIVGEEQLFFGKTKEQLDAERAQALEAIKDATSRTDPQKRNIL